MRGAFSSRSLIISWSWLADCSHGESKIIGLNKTKPCTLRWSPRWTEVWDFSLAEKRYLRLVESSNVCNAAWDAPRHILVILSFQNLNFIWSQGLSIVGLRHKLRMVFWRWTLIRCSWSWVSCFPSLPSCHLRIVIAEVRGIISFKLTMDDSKEVGYCSSLRIVVSSIDCSCGLLSSCCSNLCTDLLVMSVFIMMYWVL